MVDSRWTCCRCSYLYVVSVTDVWVERFVYAMSYVQLAYLSADSLVYHIFLRARVQFLVVKHTQKHANTQQHPSSNSTYSVHHRGPCAMYPKAVRNCVVKQRVAGAFDRGEHVCVEELRGCDTGVRESEYVLPETGTYVDEHDGRSQ
ncbi:hypothetical protein BDV95DRAFT_316205 [Massariosphaeria phaeospora]|uniref:Uncharacterized protein n=1 Tax=Massariosphaeria phaeospora TaxID=100035 RepID=A0A7C8MCW5_9PLEO|nr:hypothetical protein BDV95DRAFT_316205 [Massariosphaeria phaeospora]